MLYFLTRQQFGDKVLVIDVGTGTIDISCYRVANTTPLQVEEILQPKCQLICLQLFARSMKHP